MIQSRRSVSYTQSVRHIPFGRRRPSMTLCCTSVVPVVGVGVLVSLFLFLGPATESTAQELPSWAEPGGQPEKTAPARRPSVSASERERARQQGRSSSSSSPGLGERFPDQERGEVITKGPTGPGPPESCDTSKECSGYPNEYCDKNDTCRPNGQGPGDGNGNREPVPIGGEGWLLLLAGGYGVYRLL